MVNLNKKLAKYFRIYNKKYFKGRLPKISIVFKKPHGERAGEFASVGKTPIEIRINPKTQLGITKYCTIFTLMTLLHEMVHLKLLVENKRDVTHGYIFKREMKRLFNEGAFRGLL